MYDSAYPGPRLQVFVRGDSAHRGAGPPAADGRSAWTNAARHGVLAPRRL